MPLWIIISFCIVTILSVYSIIKLKKDGKDTYSKAARSSYVFFALLFAVIWIFQIRVPAYIILLSMLTALGSSYIGHGLGWYVKSRVFDRYLHAFGSFSFALITYCILANYIDTGGSLIFQAIFIFLLGNTIGVVFELLEMSHDVRKKEEPKAQKGLMDTDMDMIYNVIGSLLAAVFAYFFLLP